MIDDILFNMGPLRHSLIDGHRFYADQAQRRLLSQFEDIKGDTQKAADDVFACACNSLDPDRYGLGDLYEIAHDEQIVFYNLLSDMRNQTYLSVIAGMFHEWDKQLRDWLTVNIRNWHLGETVTKKVWSVDFRTIIEFLASFGFQVVDTDYFRSLDACRLVVNTYKHGEGKSLEDLKKKYPEYLDDSFCRREDGTSDMEHVDHTRLRVSDDQFKAFSDAIVSFWEAVPETIKASESKGFPDWFKKAMEKDNAAKQEAKK